MKVSNKTTAAAAFKIGIVTFFLILVQAPSDFDNTRASPSSGFSIVESPTHLPGGGWRISWSSILGRTYKLQRWNSPDLSIAGDPRWVDIATVTATGPLASASDLATDASAARYYRVMLLDGTTPEAEGLTVSNIQAIPSSVRAEGLVNLTVTAKDTNRIATVTFFDGATLLGAATQIENDAWRFFWPVEFPNNGTHSLTAKAVNLAGNEKISAALPFIIAIAKPQLRTTVGQVALNADNFQTNAAVLAPTGNIRVGLVSLSEDSRLTVDANQGVIAGQGKVNPPGLGQVFDGQFTVDTVSGWMTANTGPRLASLSAPTILTPLQLNSRTLLTPRELNVNVLSNLLRGTGLIEMQIPNQKLGTIQLDGDFSYDADAFVVTAMAR